MIDPFGWHGISATDIVQVHARLGALEKNTWREILTPTVGKKIHHFIAVSRICREAQLQLEEKRLVTDEVVSLRVTGRARVWGILQGSTLLLLWWDPEHRICPMNPADN